MKMADDGGDGMLMMSHYRLSADHVTESEQRNTSADDTPSPRPCGKYVVRARMGNFDDNPERLVSWGW